MTQTLGNDIIPVMAQIDNVVARGECRICGDELECFIKLTETPLADDFPEKPGWEECFPLDVGICNTCGLVSLMHIVNKEKIFNDHYGFFTGSSPSLIKHFREYALNTESYVQGSQLVVDIASNDGTLLSNYSMMGFRVLGVEPTKNTAEVAQKKNLQTIIKFFSAETADYILDNHGPAGLITANNVVAHVDNLHDFMKGVELLLHDEGTFVFEVHHLPNLIFKNQFDNIYHEHLSFFSLKPLIRLLQEHNLYIHDAEMIPNQGGSLRIFAVKGYAGQSEKIRMMLEQERDLGLHQMGDIYASYPAHIEHVVETFWNVIDNIFPCEIYGFGASAKSTTLLNHFGIQGDIVKYMVDKTPSKVGRFTPGTHIPIISDERIGDDVPVPDYYLLTVWNYLSDVLRRESSFVNNNGKFIIPLPVPFVL